MVELLSACGYASVPKFSEKEELVKMMARYEVIDKPRSALEQFQEGLSTLDVLNVMKQHPAEFETLYCHQGKALSANEIDRDEMNNDKMNIRPDAGSSWLQHAEQARTCLNALERLFARDRR